MARKTPGKNEKAVKDLRAKYAGTAARILAILNALQPVGFNASKAAAARRRIDALVTDLNRYARAWTKRWVPAAYKDGRTLTNGRLAIMGEQKIPRRVKEERHRKAQAALIESVFGDLYKANRSIRQVAIRYCNVMAKSAEGARELQAFDQTLVQRYVSQRTKSAVRTGLPRQDFQSRILKYLQKKLAGQKFITIKCKDGIYRNYNLKDYAELMARTNLRDAQSTATKNVAREYDHDLVEIPEHGSACDECKEYTGRVYSLSGKDPDYPVLESQPPFHPKCMCYLRVTSRNILQQRGAA